MVNFINVLRTVFTRVVPKCKKIDDFTVFFTLLSSGLVKAAQKTLMINVLQAAFTFLHPKSVKKIDNLTVFFTLLESASVKAVRRTLMKLSPDL